MTTKQVRVDWDTDTGDGKTYTAEDCGLPHTVDVPTEVVEAETDEPGAIGDWLTDEYGWCINGCQVLA